MDAEATLDHIEIPLRGNASKGLKTLIDCVDSDLVSAGWYGNGTRNGKSRYAYRLLVNRRVPLHRIILARMLGRELAGDEQVDHINGNGLDNRRSNLRLANHSENTWNRAISRNNTSRFKGVDWHNGKWRARIGVGGKRQFLGHFETPEEAYAVYCDSANRLHGEFARTS